MLPDLNSDFIQLASKTVSVCCQSIFCNKCQVPKTVRTVKAIMAKVATKLVKVVVPVKIICRRFIMKNTKKTIKKMA